MSFALLYETQRRVSAVLTNGALFFHNLFCILKMLYIEDENATLLPFTYGLCVPTKLLLTGRHDCFLIINFYTS